jgi:hypothetical protein
MHKKLIIGDLVFLESKPSKIGILIGYVENAKYFKDKIEPRTKVLWVSTGKVQSYHQYDDRMRSLLEINIAGVQYNDSNAAKKEKIKKYLTR